MFPTCATAALALALPTLIAPILADGAGGSWLTLALRHSASAAMALPLAAAMYFVRYLDLRHRRNGYDRHLLAHDIVRL